MYMQRRGLGQDSTDTTAPTFDFSTASSTAQSVLSSQVNLGQFGAVPLWAVGSVVLVFYWALSSLGRGVKSAGSRVKTRAKKIKRGFTS